MPNWLYHTVRKITWRTSDLFWTMRRAETYMACNGICWLCAKLVSLDAFGVDHIKPTVFGGTDELYNLRLVHITCHNKLHKERQKNGHIA